MGRLAKIGLALGAAASLAVAGLLLWLALLDVSEYRGTIEQAAFDATGRKLELLGPMDLAIGLRPALVVENARFANAPWGSRPEMARLERLEVQIELLPLLSGEIRVSRLVLIAPEILLETDEAGNGNWVFAVKAPKGENTAPLADADAPSPGVPAALALPLVQEVRLERATLEWSDGRSGERQVLKLDELRAEAGSSREPLEVVARGTWKETAFDVSGSLGPLDAITDPARPLGIDLAGTVSPFGDVAVVARAGGDFARRILLEDLELRIGESDLAGRVEALLDGPRPRVTASLRSERLVLPAGHPGGDPTHRGDARRPGAPGKIFSADPLPLDGLRAADAEVDLAVKELVRAAEPVRDLEVKVHLENGALRFEPLRLRFAGSAMSGALGLDASGETPELALELDARGLQLDALLDESARRHLRDGEADLAIRLRGRGRSVAAIAASLDGETKLLVNETRARTDLLDVAVGGSSRLLGMLFAEKSEWSTIHCAASNLRFRRGVATPEVLLVETEYSTIVGEGEIDLRNETLDLKISPEPKELTLSVAVPIKVGGTLAKPTYRPDEIAAVKKIGGLLSIAFFPPAAIASLAEMGSGDNPCLVLAAGGTPAKKAGVAAAAADAGKKIVGGAGSGARKIGEGLKGLFD